MKSSPCSALSPFDTFHGLGFGRDRASAAVERRSPEEARAFAREVEAALTRLGSYHDETLRADVPNHVLSIASGNEDTPTLVAQRAPSEMPLVVVRRPALRAYRAVDMSRVARLGRMAKRPSFQPAKRASVAPAISARAAVSSRKRSVPPPLPSLARISSKPSRASMRALQQRPWSPNDTIIPGTLRVRSEAAAQARLFAIVAAAVLVTLAVALIFFAPFLRRAHAERTAASAMIYAEGADDLSDDAEEASNAENPIIELDDR